MAVADPPGLNPGSDPPRSELLGLLGHDLRSPLTVVRGYAELLLQRGDELPAEGRRSALAAICRSVDRMELILDGLAELAGGQVAGPGSDAGAVLAEVIAGLPASSGAWTLEAAGDAPVAMPAARLRTLLALVVTSVARHGPAVSVSVEVGGGSAGLAFRWAPAASTPPPHLEMVLAGELAGGAGGDLRSGPEGVRLQLPLAGS